MTDQQPYEPPPAPQQPYPGAPPVYSAPGAQPAYPAPPTPPGYAAPTPQPGYPAQPGYSAQPGYPAQPGAQGYPAPAYGVAAYPTYPVYPAVPRGASSPDDPTLPLYGATFGQAISRYFKKYATFSGRASRSEYWWVQLFLALVWTVLFVIVAVLGGVGAAQASGTGDSAGWIAGVGILFTLIMIAFALGTIVPSLAIAWRRLHDANFAGPFWFLSLTYIGGLVVLVFTILPSNAQGQRFDRL